MLSTVESAYRSNNGRTAPIPVCGTSVEKKPATDSAGKVIAYGKPVVLLTDDFSASAAELFASMMQDNGRARLAGLRTMGAGGAVIGLPAASTRREVSP
jgi:C-terminal processing protease CtpA/Prc